MKGTSPDGPGETYTYRRGENLRVAGETLVIDPTTERLTSRTAGGVTTSYTYDSGPGSTIGTQLRYGWTGREWDAETGFSYHRARYFDPESRRWTQEDPIGYAGGLNVHAYVGGSPMEARDASGLETELDRTLTPYCTWGGSCVGMFGGVTRQGQQYAIDGGNGWGRSMGGKPPGRLWRNRIDDANGR